MSDRIRAWMGPLLRWETGLALVVVVIGIVGASVSSQFFTSNNIFNLGLSYGEIAIMTLPMTLIVISGEIDLSVASILGMSSALLGYLWARHWPMLGIFLLVAVVGLAAGAVNGLLVTRLGLPSLAVTIGTLAVYRGIATILLGPNTVANFPVTYTNLGVNAVPFTGYLRFTDNTTVRAGTYELNWNIGLGAIWFYALEKDINADVEVTGEDFLDNT